LPGYADLRELGRGGMGVVYKARQLGLDRVVVVKMLRPDSHVELGEKARFLAEAAAVARLQHPHIVQVYEVGERAGHPYFSMEFVEGGSLDRKIGGTPQDPRQAAELTERVARAAHVAHQAGIIHRDLKPANVFLTGDGQPKIADFGLAKRLDMEAGLTRSAAVLGTPSYMAPEQARGSPREQPVTPRSDVYSLGTVLYELLTGRPPFKGATPLDTLAQVLADDPVPPRRLQPKRSAWGVGAGASPWWPV
jgi:serine/threonine-protein kinase